MKVPLLIKLPKDTAFESLELDLYGGILQVTKIQASDLDLSASAGLDSAVRFSGRQHGH